MYIKKCYIQQKANIQKIYPTTEIMNRVCNTSSNIQKIYLIKSYESITMWSRRAGAACSPGGESGGGGGSGGAVRLAYRSMVDSEARTMRMLLSVRAKRLSTLLVKMSP